MASLASPHFVNLKLATAAHSLPVSSLSARRYVAQDTPARLPDAPQAEWAAEAISNLRHVVAGISFALIIEGAVAICIVATWGLWHVR
jgi:hypothetical protein